MTQETVVVVIDTRAGGNHQGGPASGTKHAEDFDQGGLIISDVFEDVGAHYDICRRGCYGDLQDVGQAEKCGR